MERIEFQTGDIIFKQGEITDRLYVVEEGTVCIYRNYGLPNEKFLAELEKGQSFAETAIVVEHARSVTAVAKGKVILNAYAKADFSALQQKYPDMALNIIENLSVRLRNTTDQLMEACRTIAETVEEKELKNNKGLLARLKKFAAMYDEACKDDYKGDIAENTAKAVSAYNNFGTPVSKR